MALFYRHSYAMLHSTLVTLSLFYRPSYAMLHSTLITLSLFYRHSYVMLHSSEAWHKKGDRTVKVLLK
jgi:hypothetical protein